MVAETGLYEILGISPDASASQIKKAYHKAALSSHPDKVPESEREAADVKFKTISRAYEILSDPGTRSRYDTHGSAAFDGPGNGPGGAAGHGPDLDDILAQMFGNVGGGRGGAAGFAFGGDGPPSRDGRKRKGRSEVQAYEVTLEELYKGKTTKFASTKNVICPGCEGSGGKDKAKSKKCGTCDGVGLKNILRPVGPGLVTQDTIPCGTCHGRGRYYADKDKCKKCKGSRVVSQKKILELYVPRGAREGERIVLSGEADQVPDHEPGDLVFEITEQEHGTFRRAGADLSCVLEISLQEALTGINRVVVKHLDGRGLKLNVQQPHGKVLRPGEILVVRGEGMPIKRSDQKGDLYLQIQVKFPEDGWLKDEAAVKRVRDMLPATTTDELTTEGIDEVSFEQVDDLDGFGAGSGDPRAGAEWEDEDEDDAEPGESCAQQ